VLLETYRWLRNVNVSYYYFTRVSRGHTYIPEKLSLGISVNRSKRKTSDALFVIAQLTQKIPNKHLYNTYIQSFLEE